VEFLIKLMIASMVDSSNFLKKVILDNKKTFHSILKLKERIRINLRLNLLLDLVPMLMFKKLLDLKMITLRSKIYNKEKFLVKKPTNVIQILIKYKKIIFIKIHKILLNFNMMHMETLVIL
jgi:hypothetical protein